MRPGGSSSRGGHSVRGNGGDEERKRQKRPAPADLVRAKLVASDASRKRGARAWTNMGREAPPAYARREVEEYDRAMAAAARGTRSSSGAGTSAIAGAPLPPSKREEEEGEEEQQGAAPFAWRGGYLPGDFVDDGDLDWVLERRIKDKQKQLEANREMKMKLYEYEYLRAIEESKADIPWGATDSDDSDSG